MKTRQKEIRKQHRFFQRIKKEKMINVSLALQINYINNSLANSDMNFTGENRPPIASFPPSHLIYFVRINQTIHRPEEIYCDDFPATN